MADGELDHPRFGRLYHSPEIDLWCGDFELDGKPMGVCLPGGADGPQPGCEAFIDGVIAGFDDLMARSLPMLRAEYLRCFDEPMAEDWRETMVWSGVSVPADGDETQHWGLEFSPFVDDDHDLSIWWMRGEPAFATVDG